MAHAHLTRRSDRTEEATIVLFCLVNDAYRLLNPGGHRYGSLKRLSDSEVLTLALLQQLRGVERHRAHENGEVPPAYAPDELAALHAEDLDPASGGGVVGALRDSGGWESPEGAALLDSWEDDARRRLARVEGGETLQAVYEDDEDEGS